MRGLAIVILLGAVAVGQPAEPPASQPTSQPASQATGEELCPPEALVRSLGGAYAPCVESLPHGTIDWTRGCLTAQGRGTVRGSSGQAVAMARRAARLVAARNAILLMRGIRVDAAGRFAKIEEGKVSVEGVLRDFEETAVEYDPQAATVTVTLRADLYGFRGVVRYCGRGAAAKGPRWDGEQTEADEPSHDVLVIDARGSGFVPVMYPAIVTEGGERVLDCHELSSSRLRARAMAIYAVAASEQSDVEPTARPLVLKARKGKAPGSLVLGAESLEPLSGAGARRLMAVGRLVILVDRKAAPVQ